MFGKMNGRQLAGWGYGIFWLGLLVETTNAILSALATEPLLSGATFWVGQILTLACVGAGISMMLQIRNRPW